MQALEKIMFRLLARALSAFLKKRDRAGRPRLFWGTVPLISFSYWNKAMQQEGYTSKSIMFEYYSSINKKEDFDAYFFDIYSPWYLRPLVYMKAVFPNLWKLHWMVHIARNFDILHITYEGVIFKGADFWQEELCFYRRCGLKIVALPYGADYQRFSKLYSRSWQHVLMMNYPQNAGKETVIDEKIRFLCENADCIMSGFQYDQVGRWDILPYAIYPINCDVWKKKQIFNLNDGINGPVKIYHTPNHRGIKGTEFLIEAVENLKAEGLLVELVLLEKLDNSKVRELLFTDADILVEQLILGYALSAIEGMACGLPVVSNLEDENYTRVFRRYSYLNECPIVSSSPEKIADDLRALVTDPELRRELGRAGRDYVEKYHSLKAAAATFKAIYDKIWFNKEADLINFFNPRNKNSYNNRSPRIRHPLAESKIPRGYIKPNKHDVQQH